MTAQTCQCGRARSMSYVTDRCCEVLGQDAGVVVAELLMFYEPTSIVVAIARGRNGSQPSATVFKPDHIVVHPGTWYL